MKRHGLGRGLDTLLGSAPATGGQENIANIALDKLHPGNAQPRRHFDESELQSLAASIKTQGIIQPLVARPLSGGDYEIIAGERRWRAARLAGMKTVPTVVRSLSDKEVLLVALVENIQRAALNSVEQSRGIARMVKTLNLTHAEAADSLGMSRPAISNAVRLLSLSPPVLRFLEDGKLDAGHARALLPLSASGQKAAAARIMSGNLSTRQAENLVRHMQTVNHNKTATQDADIRRLQEELSSRLAARVVIQHQKNGGGKLTVYYGSMNSLDNVLKKLRR